MKLSPHSPFDMVNTRRLLARLRGHAQRALAGFGLGWPVGLAVGLAAGLAAGSVAAPAQAEGPSVFAAASLREALDDAAGAYGGVVVSYGGSGTMARQVAQGAPADAVILAHEDWMDWLVAQGAVSGAHTLLSNSLVLIGPADAADLPDVSAQALLARLDGGRMAMGQTQSVPAGIYGRAWLEGAGLWEALSPHLAETENVRVALAFVARGEAPLGLVYATDALADPGVRVLYEVPAGGHPPIVYPAAALTEAGRDFLAFLAGSEAQLIFARRGFRPVVENP